MNPAGHFNLPTGDDDYRDTRLSGASSAAFQHVILLPFWPKSTGTWLLQVEAHFRPRLITTRRTKSLHLVSALSPDVAEKSAVVITLPDTTNPFDTLTAAINFRKSESDHSTLQQLLTAVEIGDSCLPHLLHHMPQLLGGVPAIQ